MPASFTQVTPCMQAAAVEEQLQAARAVELARQAAAELALQEAQQQAKAHCIKRT